MKRKNLSVYILITAALLSISLIMAGCAGSVNIVNTAAADTAMAEMTTAAAAETTVAETAAETKTSAADPNQVVCKNNKFSPEVITIKAGTTVTWVNQDGYIHTVTGGSSPSDLSGLFDSGNINGGGTFSFKFEKSGTYDYFCIPHFSMGMIGKVIVTE